MFFKAKHPTLAKMISLETPQKASQSVKKVEEWVFASGAQKSHQKRVLRASRAFTLAANRAEASMKRRNLSRKERVEFRLIQAIYREAANDMNSYYASYDWAGER